MPLCQIKRLFMTAPQTDSVDEMLYRISHDLRATVRALVEIPKWIEEDLSESGIALPEEFDTYFDLLNVNSSRLDQMMKDLLTYSRIGRFQHFLKIHVKDEISKVLKSLNIPSKIRVKMNVTDEVLVVSQPDFSRICLALIGNAIKHRDRETTTVQLCVTTKNNRILIQISDDGPGIKPKDYQKSCEIFTTLKPRDDVDGSGMGLAIAKRICEHFDGKLSLAPAPDFERGLMVSAEMKMA